MKALDVPAERISIILHQVIGYKSGETATFHNSNWKPENKKSGASPQLLHFGSAVGVYSRIAISQQV
jgi:hypothetical protein